MAPRVPAGALLRAAQRATRRDLATTGTGGSSSASTVVLGLFERFVDTDTTETTDMVTEVLASVRRAEVTVDGATVVLPTDPGSYVVGGAVWVLVTADRRPVRVLGPADDRPVGTGPDGLPLPTKVVTHLPKLVIDEEARQDIDEARVELDQARQDLGTASGLIGGLRDRVGRQSWVGTERAAWFSWTPLGDGAVELVADDARPDDVKWQVGGVTVGTGRTITHTFPAEGTYTVRLVAGTQAWEDDVTITPVMMGDLPEGYGWQDMTLPLDQLTAPGGTLDPDALAALWDQVVVGGFLVATEAIIGPAALIDGAVTARTLNVVTDEPDGSGLRILPTGLIILGPGGSEAVRLSVDGPTTLGVVRGDEYLAQLDDDGNLSVQAAAVASLNYKGDDLDVVLNRFDRRIAAQSQNYFGSDLPGLSGSGEIGLFEVGVDIHPGREYRISTSSVLLEVTASTDPRAVVGFILRRTYANIGQEPATPTLTSEQIGYAYVPVPGPGFYTVSFHRRINGNAAHRVLLSMYSAYGAQVRVYHHPSNPVQMDVTDHGPVDTTTYNSRLNNGGGGGGGGGGGTPVVPPAKRSTDHRIVRTWWQTYTSGNVPARPAGYTAGDKISQGRSPYITGSGSMRALVGWDNHIFNALNGATTVHNMWVFLRCDHTHNNAGGTAVIVPHGNTTQPGTFTGAVKPPSLAVHFGRGEGKWVRLPDSWYGSFKSGTYKGVGLHPDNVDPQYYMQFSPAGLEATWAAATVRLDYTK